MAKAVRLGREILPNLAVIKSVDSAEGLIGAFLKFQGPEVVGFNPVVIRFTELRSLLDKAAREGARNIMPRLCDVYDGEDLEKNTVEPIRVPNPYGAFLAGTSIAYMKGLKREDIEGGLGSRWQFIPGVPKPRKAKTPPAREPEYTDLVGELRGVLEFWREENSTAIGLSEEAWETWEPFYEELPERVREEPMIAALAARHHHHTLKTDLIYAALDRSFQIEARHLAPAILWQHFLLDSLYSIFSDFGIPTWVEEERRIVAAVRSAPNGVISRRTLQQRFWRLGSEGFHRQMKYLAKPGSHLQEFRRGRQIWVRLATI